MIVDTIPAIHRRWVAALMSDSRARTASDVADRLGIHEQAARNALARLRHLDLLDRQKVRGLVIYQRATHASRLVNIANDVTPEPRPVTPRQKVGPTDPALPEWMRVEA